MSWLSERLQDIGISKSSQRALTGGVGAVLAPVTGGLSVLVAGAATTVRQQAAAVVQGAVDDATARIQGAQAGVTAANAGANFAALMDNPLVIAGGVALLILLVRD